MLPTALPSRIDAVTVYRRGARVTRVAEIAPQGGALPPVVRLGGLSLTLDDSSVRARIEPLEAGGEAPVAHDLRVALDVPPRDPELRPADDAELEAARARVAELERLIAQLERELARLDHLALVPRPPGAEGERPPPSPLAARRSLIELRAARERHIRGELRASRDELDRARRRCELLEDQDRRASRARQAREHELRKAVIVSLRGAAAPCRLLVDYLVPGARWAPAYSVRLEPAMTAARLALRAHVAQDSGEDWSQVALTLSTAAAQAWTELPELASLRIGRQQPPPPRVGWRPPPSGVDELFRDWDRAFASLRAGAPGATGGREVMGAAAREAVLAAPGAVREEMDDEVTAVNPLAGAVAARGRAAPVARPAPPPASPPAPTSMAMAAPPEPMK
ncbi:MAG TPA: DUF4139 domain-containing protein, partial [Kofleriaceae bacterium]|nr:DUF4139 domain-containing protein [Kofleriaceae bacterium]